jgi:hypothetical protein
LAQLFDPPAADEACSELRLEISGSPEIVKGISEHLSDGQALKLLEAIMEDGDSREKLKDNPSFALLSEAFGRAVASSQQQQLDHTSGLLRAAQLCGEWFKGFLQVPGFKQTLLHQVEQGLGMGPLLLGAIPKMLDLGVLLDCCPELVTSARKGLASSSSSSRSSWLHSSTYWLHHNALEKLIYCAVASREGLLQHSAGTIDVVVECLREYFTPKSSSKDSILRSAGVKADWALGSAKPSSLCAMAKHEGMVQLIMETHRRSSRGPLRPFLKQPAALGQLLAHPSFMQWALQGLSSEEEPYQLACWEVTAAALPDEPARVLLQANSGFWGALLGGMGMEIERGWHSEKVWKAFQALMADPAVLQSLVADPNFLSGLAVGISRVRAVGLSKDRSSLSEGYLELIRSVLADAARRVPFMGHKEVLAAIIHMAVRWGVGKETGWQLLQSVMRDEADMRAVAAALAAPDSAICRQALEAVLRVVSDGGSKEVGRLMKLVQDAGQQLWERLAEVLADSPAAGGQGSRAVDRGAMKCLHKSSLDAQAGAIGRAVRAARGAHLHEAAVELATAAQDLREQREAAAAAAAEERRVLAEEQAALEAERAALEAKRAGLEAERAALEAARAAVEAERAAVKAERRALAAAQAAPATAAGGAKRTAAGPPAADGSLNKRACTL